MWKGGVLNRNCRIIELFSCQSIGMQKHFHPINQLLAQAPSLFGFNPEDSVIVFFGRRNSDQRFELGPTIRINIPCSATNGLFRLSLDQALNKLASTRCRHLYVAIIRKGWHHPSRYRIIEHIEHICTVVAEARNYAIEDVVVLDEFVSNGEWISVISGNSGFIDDIESSPRALERYWDGVDIGKDRATTRRQLMKHIDDDDAAAAWKRQPSVERYSLYDENYLQHCLKTAASAAYDSSEAQYMRSYFLQNIDSHQGYDGLVSLLITADARAWANWMWTLVPTYDRHDKAIMLFVLAVWQYMRGDGFRCEVLLDKAERYGTNIVGLAAVKDLLSLCVEPTEIINVVKGIADRLEQSA